jgi:hypothetical protein
LDTGNVGLLSEGKGTVFTLALELNNPPLILQPSSGAEAPLVMPAVRFASRSEGEAHLENATGEGDGAFMM